MSGCLWSVVVAHERRRQRDSHQLSMTQNFRTATDEQVCVQLTQSGYLTAKRMPIAAICWKLKFAIGQLIVYFSRSFTASCMLLRVFVLPLLLLLLLLRQKHYFHSVKLCNSTCII